MADRRDHFRQPKIYATTPEQKTQHNLGRFLLCGVLIIVFLLVGFFLFLSPIFKVKNIIIDGSLNEQVQDEINKLYGKNVLLFQPARTERELAKKQSSVAYLKIFKGLPDTLKIKVYVRVPKIVWQTQGKTYLIDGEGIVFEGGEGAVASEEGNVLPVVNDSKNASLVIGSSIVTKDFVQFILDLYKDFETKTHTKISTTNISETTFYLEVVTEAGWRVYLSTTRVLSNQLEALVNVLNNYRDKIREYVDLRVEGRAYYK